MLAPVGRPVASSWKLPSGLRLKIGSQNPASSTPSTRRNSSTPHTVNLPSTPSLSASSAE